MEINIGKHYANKTWRFLLPCLRGHGDTFVMKFNPVFKLAVGIHDTLLDNSEYSDSRNIYILCDTLTNESQYKEFIEYVKTQSYYVTEYCPDSELTESRKNMLVIKVPEIFNDAYDNFLQGNYSLMYLEKELSILFGAEAKKKEFNILSRNPKIIENFVKEVNQEFNTKVTEKDFINSELEMPLKKSEEIFNCSKNYLNVYFNPKTNKKWE